MPYGLCRAKKLYYVTTAGDPYIPDYSYDYIRGLATQCFGTVRENGSVSKAQKMFELCEEYDWVPISMKNDWTTIYGDGVTRK